VVTPKQPITVADLIAWLRERDQSAVVMLECEDDYYSGPVMHDGLQESTAGTYNDLGEVWHGHWVIIGDGVNGSVLRNVRPCIKIRAEG